MKIFETVADAIQYVAGKLGMTYLAVIALGLTLLAVIVIMQSIRSSYETRILKSVDRFNKYFSKQPFINDENLVEFNSRMKKVPRILRNRWQMYMLNREDVPTKYINLDTCVEKPLRTSIIERNLSNFYVFTMLICFVSLLFGLCVVDSSASVTIGLFEALLIPAVVFLLSAIFILIVRSWKNAIHADLYENFHIFEQNLNRAVTTLPAYVDYEILFTKKEIKDGIPILQQYLEKRAYMEQQELEKARENAIETETYNFEELGINGSLVLERAMKECETYISNRRRLLAECGQIQSEKDNFAKNYEATEKDYQRKLQASRENMESLKAQQEASTNRIEGNYIRKQLSDEIKKQQQLEKDSDEAAAKFKEEQTALDGEIAKRKEEIEQKRQGVESAMLLEFKNYANTLYKKLADAAVKANAAKIEKLSVENTELKELLKTFQTDKLDVLNLIDNIQTKADKSVESKGLYDNDQEKLPDTLYDQEGQPNSKIEDVKEKPILQDDKPEKDLVKPDAVEKAEPKKQEVVDAPKTDAPTQDELNDLQKKIEEENANLFKQKQEFETQINNTISKIDNGDDDDAGQKIDLNDDIPDVKPATVQTEKQETPKQETPKQETPKQEVPKQEQKQVETSKSNTLKPQTAKAPIKKTLTKTTTKPVAKKSSDDDIDDISNEMEDLLNSLNDDN